ncbi:universal stress protein [Streptomyces sp. NPDC048279]|uniref:universal stress protein n=1 Tax=Streptomyces sp. NPDC048279 TaxID=3154714 RepID=UPI003413C070
MTKPVVVGVDGSPSSLNAVGTAAHEALRSGGGLRPVHSFGWPRFIHRLVDCLDLLPGWGCVSWVTARRRRQNNGHARSHPGWTSRVRSPSASR